MNKQRSESKEGAASTEAAAGTLPSHVTAPSYSPSGRRRFTDKFRVNAIYAVKANGGNVRKTARQLGIPRDTLRSWFRGTRMLSCGASAPGMKEDVLQKCEQAVWLLLGGLADPAAILRAPLGQRALAFACVFDRWMILKGLPNPTDSVHVDDGLMKGTAKLSPEQLEQLTSILETLMAPEPHATASEPKIG